ncbi:MAG: FCSD flavin-binding domain-containing protein [Gammaproteobacteria bacterium]
MKTRMNRREFIRLAGAAGAAAGITLSLPACAQPKSGGAAGAKIVVVGGGYGGTIAAKYVRMMDPNIEVTLVTGEEVFTSCPMSNWVLVGMKEFKWLEHRYDTLASTYGITVIPEMATNIDPAGRKITLASGTTLDYDRAILSPGIGIKWGAIEGYDEAAAELCPHAWKAGPQTKLLIQQLEAMPDGGKFIIVAPADPFRCPPGPYERASLVAHYLKTNKPKSKVIILDAKENFSKEGLFFAGWKKLFGYGTDNSLIEWVSASNDGKVLEVDAKRKLAIAEFEEYQADVLNVIPPQKAGLIAEAAGLTDDSGWCPVEHRTWESKIHPNIHIVGDAAIPGPLPKSAYAANSQAKVCAAAVVDLVNGREVGEPSWVNTCYSLLAPNYGISVAMVYRLGPDGNAATVEGAGGVSPEGSNTMMEAIYAESWYNNIIDDSFA